MPDLKLKICGLTQAANIEAVASVHPDYIGLIFSKESARYVGELAAIQLDHISIKKMGVFVNEPLENLLFAARNWKLDAVQLHGDEEKDYMVALKGQLSRHVKVLKVIGVSNDFSFKKVKSFEGADYLLFDTSGLLRGGNGKTFDHSLLDKYPYELPFWLSGGLGVELESVLAKARRWPMLAGLDFNSRLEVSTGIKDVEKVRRVKAAIDTYNLS